jgi:predicted type IV restriction endonuclease
MMQKDNAREIITELVARFTEQIDSYIHSDYNETQTRRDFIDPFFKALGWDIDNQNGYAEAYCEVIHEDKINLSVYQLYGLTKDEIKIIEDSIKK